MALICDTGPLYAAMDRADRDHDTCARLFAEADEQVIVPSPVVVELDWLAGEHLRPEAFLSFLRDIDEGQVRVMDLEHDDYMRVTELLDRYRDLALGFVDAAVMAIVERLKEAKLATLDRRPFTVVRPRHVPSLRLIP